MTEIIGEGISTSWDDAADAALLIFADALDDLERVRIATQNRIRSLVADPTCEGDSAKGLDDPFAVRQMVLYQSIEQLEAQSIKDLRFALRAHPLGPWVQATVGIGEKQGARLIAAIGNPYWNDAEDRPRRGPAELWAYCGYPVRDGRRPKRKRGEKINWNPDAKMRARLCAESCMKNRNSPYRPFYDREREKWLTRETSDLHKHNHALGVMAKEILKDLWVEARRLQT